jgi:50S ribosomal protein L16 3-hydroxylase
VLPNADAPLGISDLLGSTTLSTFRDHHWTPEVPCVSRASAPLLAELRAIDALASVDALLALPRVEVMAIGLDGRRDEVSTSDAKRVLSSGCNLYIIKLDSDLPDLRQLVAPLVAPLGFTANQVAVEAFAGGAQQISPRHYDYDVNFQILLAGRKTWRVQRNRHIQNPLRSYRPDLRGDASHFQEEAYSIGRRTPTSDDDAWATYALDAGSVFFLPRGYWHEVTSETNTFALNIVLRGLTYTRALAAALAARLDRDPRFRAYLEGIEVGAELEPARTARFDTLRAIAVEQLAEISLEEAALTAYSSQRFAWVAAAAGRRVANDPPALHVPEVVDGPVPLSPELAAATAALAELRYVFTWDHALGVLAELGPVAARNLLESLLELELIEVRD